MAERSCLTRAIREKGKNPPPIAPLERNLTGNGPLSARLRKPAKISPLEPPMARFAFAHLR